MSKYLTKFLFSSLFTFILLTGAFYLLILRPKLELPKKLTTAEEIIATNHFNLIQNRLSIMGLASLDPLSPNLGTQKEELLKKALETNIKGLEELEKPLFVKSLDNKAGLNLNELIDQNKSILTEQKSILEELQTLGEINKNIFLYEPLVDLGNLDLTTEEGLRQVTNRTYAAVDGLENIRNDLEGIQGSKRVDNLISKLWETQGLLREQIELVESGEYETASLKFYDVFNNFSELREMGLSLEKDILTSGDSIELITEQTNLLLKYEFLLDKINELQDTLPEINLYSIF